MGDKRRLNLEMGAATSARLGRLARATAAASKAEVIRKAILLLEQVVAARERGDEVVSRDADGNETSYFFLF